MKNCKEMKMTDKKVLLFRADGNNVVGAGHVMRCIAIADAARKKGLLSIFVTAGSEFKHTIETHGHIDVVLNSDFRKMEDELFKLLSIIEKYSPLAIIVDSYYVSLDYFVSLRRIVDCQIVYMDDMGKHPYNCDILINYNIFGIEWRHNYQQLYASSKCPKLMLGTQFAPLRDEFNREKRAKINTTARSILVSTGGADPDHFTLSIIDAIKKQHSDKQFHIILGSMNADKREIRNRTTDMNNIIIHENVTEMAKLMISCDVAISAAGSTLYELCATQTPTITYVLEDNQILGAAGFERAGIIDNAGDIRNEGQMTLAKKLISNAIALCDDVNRRIDISKRQFTVVDGNGAARIVEQIIQWR